MSTLQPLNVNKFLERLRERAEERGYEIGSGYCDECDAKLTEADVQAGECTQCTMPLPLLDEDDESRDEHLWED